MSLQLVTAVCELLVPVTIRQLVLARRLFNIAVQANSSDITLQH